MELALIHLSARHVTSGEKCALGAQAMGVPAAVSHGRYTMALWAESDTVQVPTVVMLTI